MRELILAGALEGPPPPATGAFALAGARLIDGNGGPPRTGATIIVRHGVITEVGGADLPVPDGMIRIDAEGRSVLPGLIDAQIHLSGQQLPAPRCAARGEAAVRSGVRPYAMAAGPDNLFEERGQPDFAEVAEGVLWLLSGRARRVTALGLPMDAGYIVRRGG